MDKTEIQINELKDWVEIFSENMIPWTQNEKYERTDRR